MADVAELRRLLAEAEGKPTWTKKCRRLEVAAVNALPALLGVAEAADGLLDLVEDIAIATTPGDHGYPEDNVYEWGKRALGIVPGAKAALAALKEAP